MKTLILNYNTWRCGSDSEVKGIALGAETSTMLLNVETKSKHKYCCLGQMAIQLGVSRKDIAEQAQPCNLRLQIPLLTNKKRVYGYYRNSRFSTRAMLINDDEGITIQEKIIKLKALVKANGYKLKVINTPKSIKA